MHRAAEFNLCFSYTGCAVPRLCYSSCLNISAKKNDLKAPIHCTCTHMHIPCLYIFAFVMMQSTFSKPVIALF